MRCHRSRNEAAATPDSTSHKCWCDSSLSKTSCQSSVLETSGKNKEGNCPYGTAASARKCHSRWASKTQSAQGEAQASSCPKLQGSGAGIADSAKYLQWPKLTLLWGGLAMETGPLPSNNAPRGPSLSAALVLTRTKLKTTNSVLLNVALDKWRHCAETGPL